MMRVLLLCLCPLLWSFSLGAATWSENFSSPLSGRWVVFGKSEADPQGLRLGFEPKDWGESGIRTVASVGNPAKGLKVVLEFDDFKVARPARKETDAARDTGDISVNIQLSADHENTFFKAKQPGVLVNLFYNGEEDTLWGAIRSKEAVPRSSGTRLAGQALAKPGGPPRVKVSLKIVGNSVSVNMSVNDTVAWVWSGSLSQEIGTEAVLDIFQQNIRDGRGTFRVLSASVESEEEAAAAAAPAPAAPAPQK